MLFRLVIYDTNDDNKYASDRRHEYLGDRDAIWHLWYTFVHEQGKRHIEVFNLAGYKQSPEYGPEKFVDYNL